MAKIEQNRLIQLSKSCLSEAEKQAVIRVLDREFLGMGEEVQQFEKALTEFFGRPAVCVINGTAALHLSLQACGIGHGDEVLVPSLTYIATYQAISATGAKPISCDISQNTFLLDLNDAEKKVTIKTKALMPVHYTGGVGDLNAVYDFARKYNLNVIEDAAHAFGTIYKGKRVGSFGHVACFSFDGIKNITSGEGGCVVTDNEELLKRVCDARLLGIEKDTNKRFSNERSWDFNVNNQGWRYHMSNIMAAIGMVQLKRFPEFARKRKNLAKKYDKLFFEHKNIYPIPRDYENVVPHIYVIRIPGMKNRKFIVQKLLDKSIKVGYHYYPNHWLNFYNYHNSKTLPVTNTVFPELLTLPLHPDISEFQIEYIVNVLTAIIDLNHD